MPRRLSKSKTPAKTEELAVERADVGRVYVETGATVNMGDYNNAKITVGVELPINPTKEEVASAKKTVEIAYGVADEFLADQVKHIKEEIGRV